MKVERVSNVNGLSVRTVSFSGGDSYEERERVRKRLLDVHLRLTNAEYIKRRRESSKRWRKANPKAVMDYQRRWRKRNPEKHREQSKRYMAKNRERLLAYYREYHKKRKQKGD